jgi:hypothetical protein
MLGVLAIYVIKNRQTREQRAKSHPTPIFGIISKQYTKIKFVRRDFFMKTYKHWIPIYNCK